MMSSKDIIEQLYVISERQQRVADMLKDLSDETDDVDIVALITSLSANAYEFAVDIEDTVDTYKEILEDEMEELDDVEAVDIGEEDLEISDVD